MKSETKLDFFKVSGDLVGVITNCARGLFFERAILTPFCACVLEMTDKGGDSASTEQSN